MTTNIEAYKGRGVYVPEGLEASWIMEGALALEREFDIAPYTSREMVRAILQVVLPLVYQSERSRDAFQSAAMISPSIEGQQHWINEMSVFCQEAILCAVRDSGGGTDAERSATAALEHINRILGSIRFGDGNSNNSN